MKQRLAIRVFGILICCVGATLLAIRDWPTYNDTVLGMTAPKVPGEYKKEITVGVKADIYWRVDGREHFVNHYRRTWNECRDAFYRGKTMTRPILYHRALPAFLERYFVANFYWVLSHFSNRSIFDASDSNSNSNISF